MGHTLLWIENLITALLMMAVIVAIGTRLPLGRGRQGLPVLGLLLLILFYGLIAAAAVHLRIKLGMANLWLCYILSLGICVFAGSVVLTWWGLKEDQVTKTSIGRSWPLGKVSAAFAVVATLHAMTLWNIDMTIRHQLSTLRAEAGALALAVTPAPVSDSENAWFVYQRAFELLPESDDWRDAWSDSKRRSELNVQDAKISSFVQHNQATIQLLRRAANMPEFSSGASHRRPRYESRFPDVEQFRQSARLLLLDAMWHSDQGQSDVALADVAALFGMADHLRRQPMFLTMDLCAEACRSGSRALQHILMSDRVSIDDAFELRLRQSISGQEAFARSVVQEEAWGLLVFSRLDTKRGFHVIGPPSVIKTADVLTPLPPRLQQLLYRVFLVSNDIEAFRTVYEQYRKAATKPPDTAIELLRSTDAEFVDDRTGQLITDRLVIRTEVWLTLALEADARFALAELAFALARYRAEQRALPDHLDQLVPTYIQAIPRDPFDGQPLKMKVTPDQVVLYSLGPDMNDDGGLARAYYLYGGDVTFVLPR